MGQPVGHAGDGPLDAVQAALELGIGQAHLQTGDGIFQPVEAFLMGGAAALVFHLVGGALVGAGFDLLQRMVQGIGVELGGLLDGDQARIDRLFGGLDAMADGLLAGVDTLVQRLVGIFGIHPRLADAAGELFQVAGDLHDLAGGIVGGGGDLVGQTRQALMQSLDRVLDAVIGGGAFQPLQPLVQAHHVQAQLVEGLGLLAGGDVDFLGGAGNDAVAFPVAAFAGIQAAAKAPQLVLDAAPGFVRFVFAAPDPGHHLFGVAAAGGRRRQAPAVQGRAGGRAIVIRHGGDVLFHARKTAQNAPCQPFADRQSFAPGSGPRRFPRLWRDTGNVPW